MRNPAVQSRTLTELSKVFGNYNKTFKFILIFRILESDTREHCAVYTTWLVLVLKIPIFLTSFGLTKYRILQTERKRMCLHHRFLKMKEQQSLTVPGWSSSKLAQMLCGLPESSPSFLFLWIFSGGTVSSLSKWLKNKTYANIYDLTFTAFIIMSENN